MKRILVDSDVIIDYLRIKLGLLDKLFVLQKEGTVELFISGITVIEVYSGLSADRMEKEIDQLINCFGVVDLDKNLGKKAGEIRRRLRNKKHFERIPGLKFWKG